MSFKVSNTHNNGTGGDQLPAPIDDYLKQNSIIDISAGMIQFRGTGDYWGIGRESPCPKIAYEGAALIVNGRTALKYSIEIKGSAPHREMHGKIWDAGIDPCTAVVPEPEGTWEADEEGGVEEENRQEC